MLKVKGKYATAKVFTDVVDEKALAQVEELMNQPYVKGNRVRMMPDIHAGAGCTIGTTMTIKDKICPNLVGVDIGCGMTTVHIIGQDIDLERLDRVVHERIPAGFNVRQERHWLAGSVNLSELCCAKSVDIDRAYKSIGTLGGGNHFIEVDRDSGGNLYLVIHSGSRHLGVEIANYYQEAAYRALTAARREEIREEIAALRAAGRASEIEGRLITVKVEKRDVPKALAYVEGELFEQYLHDMRIAQQFASINRTAMVNSIIEGMKWDYYGWFETVHNYIDLRNMILRKGAISAQSGEKLLIPINMRDGSLLCTGKGNADWNFSAPHGAGRLMSRSAAKEKFTVAEFKEEMKGVYSTTVGRDTLDECPMAYKSMEDILKNIEPTVTVDAVLKPIYNFKAGEA